MLYYYLPSIVVVRRIGCVKKKKYLPTGAKKNQSIGNTIERARDRWLPSISAYSLKLNNVVMIDYIITTRVLLV